VFADQLSALAKAGYKSASLDELHAHVTGDETLPPNRVVITFDDGYLDNWTVVVPLLARYGFNGAIFVSPDFVDPRDIVRPSLDDTGFDSLRYDEVENAGFMSWRELSLAAERGVLSVECHGLTHAWYPTGPDVVDWHHPGDRYYWLDWNAHPDEKPFYLERLGTSKVPWGAPVYAHGKSLEVTRYFPDPNETERIVRFVAGRGGESFFQQNDWSAVLQSELDNIRKEHPPEDRCETPDERRERYHTELTESKRRIEEHLGSRVGHFVFPGGGYNDESFEMARSIFTSVAVRSPERERIRNRQGDPPGMVSRIGTQLFTMGSRHYYAGGGYLVDFIKDYQGSALARRRRQAKKFFYLAGMRMGFRG
jgi:peptidoglycan/xylan/chitin deacetylase (PgdA/CDA1 family)